MPSRPQQTVMAEATKVTARLSVTCPVPRPPVVCEKNIVRLFRYPKGRTIRKVMGRSGAGGRAGEVQKNYLRKGKLNEKKIMHVN